MKELSRMSDDEMDKIADKMSDYFLRAVEEDVSKSNFDSLEKRLKIKYMRDDHSAIVLDGRKGVRIIVDHGISEQWSEINLSLIHI